MTKFRIETIYKNPKWTGQTVTKLEHLQSIIDLRRRKSHEQSNLKNGRKFDNQNDSRIIINVSGLRFETYKSTLERYPDTLLGNIQRRSCYYDKKHDEYFFDRHRLCFEAILYFYQSSGRLRRPENVSLDTFLEEITYFDLGLDALRQVRKDEELEEAKKVKLPENRFCRQLWANLEYPQYSMTAKIINIFSIIFILLSAIELAIQTLPNYRGTHNNRCEYEGDGLFIDSNRSTTRRLCPPNFQSSFFIVQSICIGFFTIEFLLRLISCPSFFDFIKSIPNWVDFFAIVPYYITLIISVFGTHNEISSETYFFLSILRIFRFLRVFKLYRIFQHIKSLRVLGSTIKESIPDFIILLSFLTLSGFLFGAAMYFAENNTNKDFFDSIPKATYYGIITLTAVGYGDLVPITVLGRSLACLAAIYGVSVVSMLVSVLVDRYQRVYARKHFLNEEYTENTVLNDSYRRSINNDKCEESPIDMEKQITVIPELYNHVEHEQDKDESSGKVRFILGYLSDDEPDDDNDNIDESDHEIIHKVAQELFHSTSNRYRSMNSNN
ncbi:unnamed protein product [Rotaria sordida]|uniref:BTB domain-containing protein n=1 Tax=Rotaria sordida TaxID=392033 RepID=A0A813V0P6_9BILA|nr:unnamed protein product [Rotaria sordida]CAF0829349.1 unnamed protein product [Rotaria sordida]CAF0836568.1 unnamed protein product [Rotaria sordida]CAF3560546.1 unnamed protein product [Rotaria sordida]CAF3961231.1 unnamed protein product [Rotaria sordida]